MGDSAYPLMRNIIVPYKNYGKLSQSQKYFNKALNSNRVIIENAFGLLKMRFRSLLHVKLKGLRKICHFIRACCVLHNLMLTNDDDLKIENNINTNDSADDDDKMGNEISFDDEKVQKIYWKTKRQMLTLKIYKKKKKRNKQ